MVNIQHCDFIELKDLELPLQIGVHAYEKKMIQKLKIDVKIYCDFKEIHDDIHQTIDYSIIRQELLKFIDKQHFELIETFANFFADWINNRFNAIATEVLIKKLHAVPHVNYVGVRAFRFSKSVLSD